MHHRGRSARRKAPFLSTSRSRGSAARHLTEYDWLLLRSASELAGELSAVPRARPLYLFAAAVLRRAWDWLPSDSWRFAVEATERFARGQTSLRDFTESWVNAE